MASKEIRNLRKELDELGIKRFYKNTLDIPNGKKN